jgi:hypothetical protein
MPSDYYIYHLLSFVTIIHATSNHRLVLTGLISGALVHYPAVLGWSDYVSSISLKSEKLHLRERTFLIPARDTQSNIHSTK